MWNYCGQPACCRRIINGFMCAHPMDYLNYWILPIVRALLVSSHASVVGTRLVGVQLRLLMRATVFGGVLPPSECTAIIGKSPEVLSFCIPCPCRAG